MSLADKQYLRIVQNVLEDGYYDDNRTGIPTYKLPHQIMQFNLEKEFPIVTTKLVSFITLVKELLWIYKEQSNDVRRLQEQKVSIWDEWMKEDGTIGTAYGFVVKEFDQLNTLIHTLKTNPQDRRMMIDLWQIQYLKTGALPPCAFLTMWDVSFGRLNCMLIQRSGDLGLGIPFNTSQYAVLVHLLAQVTGLKPGLFTHVINNAHVYENHVEALKIQLSKKNEAYEAPKLWINPSVTNFYDFTPDDIKLIGYQHHDKLEMEVAV
ncbi:thymidylate synthase (plasmid) [Aneurinibacillus sp. Ricciae_BoGa-3]|uniref:thymidylate synthase n=1 Tax=Aneurinibacillus sp. Ricciae_BoGa-3 TaxID=3022697 RepID=UPI0023407FD0|nr:thymidylate synthase [Aneurinibacillus sp. Ricciae_BoGa-3]WCK57118.1 thymidylate synthase [Aneurinibacillus sp. Ricciae_BoGa-3]